MKWLAPSQAHTPQPLAVGLRRAAALLLLGAGTIALGAVDVSVTAGDTRTAAQIASANAYASYTAPSDKVKHVAKTGSNTSGDGSLGNPWETIEFAAQQLTKGQTLYVHAGTYPNVYLNLNSTAYDDGDADEPITIRNAPGEARPVLVGKPPNTDGSIDPIIRATRPYWIFDGLEFDGKGRFQNAVKLSSHHLTLRNSLVRDQGRDAVLVDGQDIYIYKNEIRDVWEASGSGSASCTTNASCAAGQVCSRDFSGVGTCRTRQDGHGIDIVSNAARILVKDNKVHDVSGDGSQCSGPAQGYTPGSSPVDITFEGNEMYTSPDNLGYTENAIDIKDCSQITMRREKYHTYHAVPSSSGNSSGGSTMVFHIQAQKLLLEDSEISDSCEGISIGNENWTNETVGNILIRRNVFRDIYKGANGCSTDTSNGYGISVNVLGMGNTGGMDIYNNTFATDVGALKTTHWNSGKTTSDVDFWNNIVLTSKANAEWVHLESAYMSGVELDHNLFFHTDGSQDHFSCNDSIVTGLTNWRASSCNEGGAFETNSSIADPKFMNAAGDDYRLNDGSPAIDTALNSTGLTACGSAPDKGGIEKCAADDPGNGEGPPPTDPPVDDTDWILQVGTTVDEYGYATAVDSSGNVFVAGYSTGSLDFTNQGGKDAVLRKYTSTGTSDWGRQLGNAGEEHAYGVAVDSSGAPAIGGLTDNALYSTYYGGTYDGFLSRYDSSGTRQWIQMIGTAEEDGVYAVASDGTNYFAVGYTYGALTGTNAGMRDAFVAKYNASGTQLWVRQLGTAADDVAYAATVDSSGNVYLAGFTSGTFSSQTAAGAKDVFLAKYDSSGTLSWVKQWGTPADDIAWSLAMAGSSIAMGGSTQGSLAFTHQGGVDAFAAKWTTSGTLSWSRQLGSAADEWAYGVAGDSSGNVYITGTNRGPLYREYVGGYDTYLARYTSTGTREWIKHLGSTDDEVARGAVASGTSVVYVAGGTRGALPGKTSVGGKDLFLAKYVTTDVADENWDSDNFRYLAKTEDDLLSFVQRLSHPKAGGYGKVSSTRTTDFNTFVDALLTAINQTVANPSTGDWCDVKDKASAAGYAVQRFYDQGTGRWFVYGYDTTSFGQAYFFINPFAKRNIILEVPHEGFETNTGAQGARLFRALAARALIINKEHRCSDPDYSTCSGQTSVCTGSTLEGYRESDVAHHEQNTLHLLHKKFTDLETGTRFIQLHGMTGSLTDIAEVSDSTTRDLESTSVSVTFANLLDAQVPNPSAVASCQETNGDPPSGLCAATNVQGRYTNDTTLNVCTTGTSQLSNRFLHLEQHPTLRDDDPSDGYYWGDVSKALEGTWGCTMNNGSTDCTLGESPQTVHPDQSCSP